MVVRTLALKWILGRGSYISLKLRSYSPPALPYLRSQHLFSARMSLKSQDSRINLFECAAIEWIVAAVVAEAFGNKNARNTYL